MSWKLIYYSHNALSLWLNLVLTFVATFHVSVQINHVSRAKILSGSSFAPETKNILKGLGRTVPHQMVIGKQVEKTEQLS